MIRRYPLVAFFALAYLLTWPFQILSYFMADRVGMDLSNEDNLRHIVDLLGGDLASDRLWPLLVFFLGQSGPVVAAFVVTAAIYGSVGVRDLGARTVKWRVAPQWYLTVLLLPLLMIAVCLAAAFVTGGFELGPFEPDIPWSWFIFFVLYMIVFTGLAEEPGWRGFALPHLQASRTAMRSSWILGVAWGVWHFPFIIYYNLDEPFLLIPAFFGLTVGIVGWTIVNTWVYNNTGSVFMVILLHGWNGAAQSYFILAQPNFLAASLFTLLPWGIAIYLSKRYGDENLADVARPKWWPGIYNVQQRGEPVPVLAYAGDSGETVVQAET